MFSGFPRAFNITFNPFFNGTELWTDDEYIYIDRLQIKMEEDMIVFFQESHKQYSNHIKLEEHVIISNNRTFLIKSIHGLRADFRTYSLERYQINEIQMALFMKFALPEGEL